MGQKKNWRCGCRQSIHFSLWSYPYLLPYFLAYLLCLLACLLTPLSKQRQYLFRSELCEIATNPAQILYTVSFPLVLEPKTATMWIGDSKTRFFAPRKCAPKTGPLKGKHRNTLHFTLFKEMLLLLLLLLLCPPNRHRSTWKLEDLTKNSQKYNVPKLSSIGADCTPLWLKDDFLCFH